MERWRSRAEEFPAVPVWLQSMRVTDEVKKTAGHGSANRRACLDIRSWVGVPEAVFASLNGRKPALLRWMINADYEQTLAGFV